MTNLSINTSINIFKNNMATVIHNSQLPVGILYYVLKDIVNDIQDIYKETLQKEMQEMQQEKEDVKEHQE